MDYALNFADRTIICCSKQWEERFRDFRIIKVKRTNIGSHIPTMGLRKCKPQVEVEDAIHNREGQKGVGRYSMRLPKVIAG